MASNTVPEMDVLQDAMRPETTGNFLVVFKDDIDLNARTQAVDRAYRAAATNGAPAIMMMFSPSDRATTAGEQTCARLFRRFGVAVVEPLADTHVAAMQQALKEDHDVLEVRPEYYLFALDRFVDTSASTWGLKATGAVDSPFTGSGIKVAVLDTGIDLDHPDFQGRSITLESFVPDGTTDDIQGHGTHCAGTIFGPRAPGPGSVPGYGCAPDATLYVGKVLNDSGFAPEGAVFEGMEWALDAGCDIVSMSLGRAVRRGEPPSMIYERIAASALEEGCLFVAAAGNDSARASGRIAPVSEPANSPSIMAVAAVDEILEVADFSNGGINRNGGAVDIAAPGVGVFSASPPPRFYMVLQGTSMACPHVAGIAALWAESDPTLRGQPLWDVLVANAKALSASERDVGAGLVRAPGIAKSGMV
ncbi:S8 family peptidase [Aurantimonas marina]|uniref:S8 family peptidase n=1 Tax=Aurantimonas marina TaxID=2780508 RepID=UPI001E648CDD|nr:S8 family serine peptidase [Aurantimonas marina]